MLPCQRALFDIPREVAWLNAAAWSPLPLAVQAAGHAGVARKGRPWEVDPGLGAAQHERARQAAAALIGASSEDVTLIPSVSYGVATAGKIFVPPPGSRVLVLEDDHASPVLEWMARAPAQGFSVETVARPADGDWTAAVEEAIARPGAPPVSLASISSVHWSDGGVIDLPRIAPLLRAAGAALLVDATHAAGVMPIDVAAIDPDFLIFPTYKWVLGPMAGRSCTSRSGGRTPSRSSRRPSGGARCPPNAPPISPTSPTRRRRGASTWGSATTSSVSRWRPLAWR